MEKRASKDMNVCPYNAKHILML